MIDRPGRDAAADAIERYWAGLITNDQLESLWPNSRDRGIIAVESFIWLLYDDTREHRICDEDKSDPEMAMRVSACIDFLRSDEEYEWPHFANPRGHISIYPQWMVWASFGLLGLVNRSTRKRIERYWRDMHAAGDVTAWPFIRRSTTHSH
jgi:hypothetical protein